MDNLPANEYNYNLKSDLQRRFRYDTAQMNNLIQFANLPKNQTYIHKFYIDVNDESLHVGVCVYDDADGKYYFTTTICDESPIAYNEPFDTAAITHDKLVVQLLGIYIAERFSEVELKDPLGGKLYVSCEIYSMLSKIARLVDDLKNCTTRQLGYKLFMNAKKGVTAFHKVHWCRDADRLILINAAKVKNDPIQYGMAFDYTSPKFYHDHEVLDKFVYYMRLYAHLMLE